MLILWCREGGSNPSRVYETRKLLIVGIDRIAQIATTDNISHNSGTMRCKVAAFTSPPAKSTQGEKAKSRRGACRQGEAGAGKERSDGGWRRWILGDFTYNRSLRWPSALSRWRPRVRVRARQSFEEQPAIQEVISVRERRRRTSAWRSPCSSPRADVTVVLVTLFSDPDYEKSGVSPSVKVGCVRTASRSAV